MTKPTEFKDPSVTVMTAEDNPVLHEVLKNLCLNSWESIHEVLKKSHDLNEAQTLTGMISMYTGFLSIAFGSEHTVTLLNEIQRKARIEANSKAH